MNKISSLCFLTLFATQVAAAPQSYDLNLSESRIDFTYDLQGSEFAGEIPISNADVALDFQDLSNSDISVTFNVSGVSTGFGPLTEAIKSESVLATGQFPTATFRSGSIVQNGTKAQLNGQLTLRGTTQPVTLNAEIFRQRGSEVGDLSELIVLITGSFDRHAFGASGYSGLVDPEIELRVVTTLDRN
ncbi:Polyisoprenoid-binding protein YceI [Cognatiyoonia sediminum]|uniref:Polyisoprenoid-binding protein YceI n=1 Tax=Cognatiyoonia sediminum TaxID=1508389 RepID=A0A1M5M737_9RHOB|nr:YceI family protein [Cognatiyoonia sediminum]SHG73096.1 Polyisoprenoid-binding protein YceI [Cognatiyoonia sediminum]